MIMKLKRDPNRPELIEVSLELGAAFRAVANFAMWGVLWFVLGSAVTRAYFQLVR